MGEQNRHDRSAVGSATGRQSSDNGGQKKQDVQTDPTVMPTDGVSDLISIIRRKLPNVLEPAMSRFQFRSSLSPRAKNPTEGAMAVKKLFNRQPNLFRLDDLAALCCTADRKKTTVKIKDFSPLIQAKDRAGSRIVFRMQANSVRRHFGVA